MPNGIDPHADTPDRVRRNFQRLAVGPKFPVIEIAGLAKVKSLEIDDAGVAPATTVLTVPVTIDTFGDDTKLLGGPAAWLKVNVSGTDYLIPLFTP